MATVAELERVEAILSRLVPLNSKQRGEPIRAEDWNIVIDVLVEVAQALLAVNQEGVVAEHSHEEQISSSWLTPELRTKIERGPIADPGSVSRLQKLERLNQRLNQRLDGLAADIKSVRSRVTEVATRDVTRAAELTAIRRRIEGLSDARADVLDLRASLNTIHADLIRAK